MEALSKIIDYNSIQTFKSSTEATPEGVFLSHCRFFNGGPSHRLLRPHLRTQLRPSLQSFKLHPNSIRYLQTQFLLHNPQSHLKSTILSWCQKSYVEPPKPLDSISAEKIVYTLKVSQGQNSETHTKIEDRKVLISEDLI